LTVTGSGDKAFEHHGVQSMQAYIKDSGAFDPEVVSAMSKAFADTCNALKIFAGDKRGREVVANRIIEIARSGMVDPVAIKSRVVAEARVSL
jgi:hypothetical protein